jgi:hypothetical protein
MYTNQLTMTKFLFVHGDYCTPNILLSLFCQFYKQQALAPCLTSVLCLSSLAALFLLTMVEEKRRKELKKSFSAAHGMKNMVEVESESKRGQISLQISSLLFPFQAVLVKLNQSL